MPIGVVLVGDELLSGKRRDKHLERTVEMLDVRGLALSWVRIAGDDPQRLADTFRQTLAGGDIVLSFGGIGATPDDCTRQAVAAAAGLPLVPHPEAVALLRAKYGSEATPQRLRMVEFPQGARMIPNSYNQIPGFTLADHHFVPGFPQMAWPMTEWVMDHYYAHLHQERMIEFLARVEGAYESQLIQLMQQVIDDYPGVRVASLPHLDGDNTHIELGVRGVPALAGAAWEALTAGLDARAVAWRRVSGGDPQDRLS